MGKMKKITVEIPADLLKAAQNYTGQGVTETVRKALEDMRRAWAYKTLLDLRGKVKFEHSWQELRAMDDDE
jgi:hypothetical protein